MEQHQYGKRCCMENLGEKSIDHRAARRRNKNLVKQLSYQKQRKVFQVLKVETKYILCQKVSDKDFIFTYVKYGSFHINWEIILELIAFQLFQLSRFLLTKFIITFVLKLFWNSINEKNILNIFSTIGLYSDESIRPKIFERKKNVGDV